MNIVSFASARPNFVKLAAVHHALLQRREIQHVIIHTGQHSDPLFSDVFFKELSIALPAVNLNVGSRGANEDTIMRTYEAALPVLRDIRPDVVLVYGDVSGAVGSALAAHELSIPIGHVEAGLRSFDDSMPEEGNRKTIDHVSKYLFVTEDSGVSNLKNEGVSDGIFLAGNTMIDTLARMTPLIQMQTIPFHLPKQFAVVTLHRPSNVDTDDALMKNIDFLNQVAEFIPIVFPIHRRTEESIKKFGLKTMLSTSVKRIDPLSYLQFLKLASLSAFILTDSGGIQEEAVMLRKRCFTLRMNTERPATIHAGSNQLINIHIPHNVHSVLNYAQNPVKPIIHIPPLWDGETGKRIVDALCEHVQV